MCDRILPDMHRSHGVYKIAELFLHYILNYDCKNDIWLPGLTHSDDNIQTACSATQVSASESQPLFPGLLIHTSTPEYFRSADLTNCRCCPDSKNFSPVKRTSLQHFAPLFIKCDLRFYRIEIPLFSYRRNYIHIRRFQTLPPEILSQAVSFGASGDSGRMRHVRSPRTSDNHNCIRSESPHGTVRLCHHSPRSVGNTIRFQDQTGLPPAAHPSNKISGNRSVNSFIHR